jgi:hypothetical protein
MNIMNTMNTPSGVRDSIEYPNSTCIFPDDNCYSLQQQLNNELVITPKIGGT